MSDYSEQGALPVEDAAVDDPPTEDEVRAAQEREHPEQAATREEGERPSLAHDEPLDRHPGEGQLPSDTDVQAERQAEGLVAEAVADAGEGDGGGRR